MTISSGEIRRNMSILFEGEVYIIVEWQHRQAPKAPPTLTLKLRNVKTGNVYERKVQGNQKLTAAPMDRRSSQYLYSDGDIHTFMDNESYDQFPITEDVLGDAMKYIKLGESLDVLFYEEAVIPVEPPITVNLEVTGPGAAAAISGDALQRPAQAPGAGSTSTVQSRPVGTRSSRRSGWAPFKIMCHRVTPRMRNG